MNLSDSFFIHYLHRFDKYCFAVQLHGKTYTIGEGEKMLLIARRTALAAALLLDMPLTVCLSAWRWQPGLPVAIWCMFAQVFPQFQDSFPELGFDSVFAVQSTLSTSTNRRR